MFTKKEKYSIRKFKVGAASIVVGIFMYGATSNNEVSASEQEEQSSKMEAETKSQLEQAPKVVGEKTKQKSEAVNNEIYTDQPLKEQKPEGESGQNNGNQEEIEENNIIDIIEDTTPEGESGQNNGNQEEIEENNIIDIIEDTTPEGESGQNNGNQEEIE
ncbi:TPA: YSIRK-type signal peptide-containing protein, partial [Staphylococcus aureus]